MRYGRKRALRNPWHPPCLVTQSIGWASLAPIRYPDGRADHRKRAGVTAPFTLISPACANRLKPTSVEALTRSQERGAKVRSSSGVRSVLLVVAVLGFVLGGCGSLSGK